MVAEFGLFVKYGINTVQVYEQPDYQDPPPQIFHYRKYLASIIYYRGIYEKYIRKYSDLKSVG